MAKKKEETESNLPNIQFVGKRQKLNKLKGKIELVAKEVPAFVTDAGENIILPKGIEKGIYLAPETAQRLFALRPRDFKVPVTKSRRKALSKVGGKQ